MKSSNLMLAICFLQGLVHLGSGDLQDDIRGSHSRKRRYVVFPEGSTLSIAACTTTATLTAAPSIFTSGVAWALSYDLPNETIHTKDNRLDFPVTLRRHKRDLFVRMEKLMDSAGIDGRNCVLKTICETVQHLTPRQGILEEVLRVIFTYPPESESLSRRLLNAPYEEAHRMGQMDENCNDLFPCPISLLKLGLGFGKYPQALF